MKKILKYLSISILLIALSGCSMSNTPTKRVEDFLNSYTHHNSSVLNQLKEMVDMDSLMNDEQKNVYSDIMKKQYKDLTYEIKDEVIDENTATVTVEIEVYDYYKVNKETEQYYNNNPNEFKTDENGMTKEQKYVEYRLGKLQSATDRVRYTIDFVLTKAGNKWILNEIDDTTRQKIHGLYTH